MKAYKANLNVHVDEDNSAGISIRIMNKRTGASKRINEMYVDFAAAMVAMNKFQALLEMNDNEFNSAMEEIMEKGAF